MENTTAPQPLKRKRKKIIWIIVGIVIATGISAFAFLYGEYKTRQHFYDTNGDNTSYAADSVHVDGWASPEDYANWKDAIFTIPQYNDIPVSFQRGIVKIFMDNNFLTKDNLRFFTKIKDRAPRVFTYGNFTGQGDKEMAFLLEQSDFESCDLFIIPEKGNVLYWKEFKSELPTIRRFAKGSLIFMGDMKLVPAPLDGIIKQTKSSKYVYLYNTQTKTFDEYYQYTEADIKEAEEQPAIEEGDEESADSTATQNKPVE